MSMCGPRVTELPTIIGHCWFFSTAISLVFKIHLILSFCMGHSSKDGLLNFDVPHIFILLTVHFISENHTYFCVPDFQNFISNLVFFLSFNNLIVIEHLFWIVTFIPKLNRSFPLHSYIYFFLSHWIIPPTIPLPSQNTSLTFPLPYCVHFISHWVLYPLSWFIHSIHGTITIIVCTLFFAQFL